MDQTIARIAEQLGFQAARIWPQVVMVTWLTSIFWTVADPLIIAGCLYGTIRCLRSMRNLVASSNKDDPYLDAFPALMGGGIAIIALGVLAIIVLAGWPDYIAGAFYPEATTVLRIAKGLK